MVFPKPVFDRDVRFMSYFWKTLWHLVGIKLKFSTAFHPQTDGQIEVVNCSLGNLLQCLVGEANWNWDSILSTAQLAYNSSVNRSIGASPFEVVHGYTPRKPLDLLPMFPHVRISEFVEAFARHIHDLHNEICMDRAYNEICIIGIGIQFFLQLNLHIIALSIGL